MTPPSEDALPLAAIVALERHRIHGDPYTGLGEWYCSCGYGDTDDPLQMGYDSAEEHIAKVVLGIAPAATDIATTWCREHKTFDGCPEHCPRCHGYFHGSSKCPRGTGS